MTMKFQWSHLVDIHWEFLSARNQKRRLYHGLVYVGLVCLSRSRREFITAIRSVIFGLFRFLGFLGFLGFLMTSRFFGDHQKSTLTLTHRTLRQVWEIYWIEGLEFSDVAGRSILVLVLVLAFHIRHGVLE